MILRKHWAGGTCSDFISRLKPGLKSRDDTDIEGMREWKLDRLKQTEEEGCVRMGKELKMHA